MDWITDLACYGIHITRDGKRIAPEDFYAMPDPADMTDADLLVAYHTSDAEPGDPWLDALTAEIERRNLDI